MDPKDETNIEAEAETPEVEAPAVEATDEAGSEAIFDMHALIAEAEAEVAGGEEDPAESESDGPDSGELPEDDRPQEEAEDESDEGEEAEESAEQPASPDPRLKELEALRAELAELKRPKVAEAPPKAKPKTADQVQFERAVYLAMFGSEQHKTEWESLPAQIKEDAREFSKIYAQREVEYALNPAQRFRDQFAPIVEEYVQQALAPISQERHDRQVKEILTPYMEKLPSPAERNEFARIWADIPGADSPDPGVQRKVLALAYEKLQWSKKEADLAAREQKAGAVERQQKAIKKARKRTGTGGGSKPAARKKAPDLRPGQDLAAYAEMLANGDYDLDP